MITLHGGLDQNITFADLLINSNYIFLEKILSLNLLIMSIFILLLTIEQSQRNILEKSKHLMVPDNFFQIIKT